MGLFYTNLTLRGPTQQQVARLLAQMGREAYVSPTIDRVTVIYDKELEDQNVPAMKQLASQLSLYFQCPALVVLVHDDDVLWYALFHSGTLVDDYDSTPGYFDSNAPGDLPPSGGDAHKLCESFGVPTAIEKIDYILHYHSDEEDFVNELVCAQDRHRALLEATGLPLFAADTGFYAIEAGVLPEGLDTTALVQVGGKQ